MRLLPMDDGTFRPIIPGTAQEHGGTLMTGEGDMVKSFVDVMLILLDLSSLMS